MIVVELFTISRKLNRKKLASRSEVENENQQSVKTGVVEVGRDASSVLGGRPSPLVVLGAYLHRLGVRLERAWLPPRKRK